MKFYRITTCEYADDLSGEGAFLFGGRWNSKGIRLLYTAEHGALAMLEALAHITMSNAQRAYCRVVMEIGDGLLEPQPIGEEVVEPFTLQDWYLEIKRDVLPAEWRKSPGPDQLREIGDAFAKEGKYLAMKVPSVVEPESFNYLFNPNHSLFSLLKKMSSEPVSFDQRLVSVK